MKNLLKHLWAITFLAFAFASCYDENSAPEVISDNLSDTTIHVGNELIFESEIKSDYVFNYEWHINNELKSSEPTFVFTPEISGEYKVKVVVENKFGKDSIESLITVLPRILTIDFENLTLGSNNYWNGSDGLGSFNSGIANFRNNYDAAFMYWEGMCYSNMHDSETSGYGNQYSVYNKDNGENKFAIYYNIMVKNPSIEFSNNQLIEVQSIDICNSTYTALSMKNGDAFSRKFGGETGNDKDFLKITIEGYDLSGKVTSTLDVYLADFRSDNNSEDYIIGSWKKVDISSLGAVNKIGFKFDSSDKGDWGINTPCYFCLDNIAYYENEDLLNQ